MRSGGDSNPGGIRSSDFAQLRLGDASPIKNPNNSFSLDSVSIFGVVEVSVVASVIFIDKAKKSAVLLSAKVTDIKVFSALFCLPYMKEFRFRLKLRCHEQLRKYITRTSMFLE